MKTKQLLIFICREITEIKTILVFSENKRTYNFYICRESNENKIFYNFYISLEINENKTTYNLSKKVANILTTFSKCSKFNLIIFALINITLK